MDGRQTESFLDNHRISRHLADTFNLPEMVDLGQPTKRYFPAETSETQTVSVWISEASAGAAKQYPYGSIQIGNKLLCLDVNTGDFHRNLFLPIKRTTRFAPTLIAPWSHYLDGSMWGGYYDFVFLVAAKLCRIKEALPEAEFQAAFVSYPLFGTAYERDFLTLLGVASDRIIDSRITKVTFERCVLANAGHWFYPNKADILALRKYVLTQIPAAEGTRKRIYISRSGRRRILNEPADLRLSRTLPVPLPSRYGFTRVPSLSLVRTGHPSATSYGVNRTPTCLKYSLPRIHLVSSGIWPTHWVLITRHIITVRRVQGIGQQGWKMTFSCR